MRRESTSANKFLAESAPAYGITEAARYLRLPSAEPFVSFDGFGQRSIAIDPRVGFGRPIVERAGVSTRAIADRIDAGESPESLAEDYGLATAEVEQAVVYERAA